MRSTPLFLTFQLYYLSVSIAVAWSGVCNYEAVFTLCNHWMSAYYMLIYGTILGTVRQIELWVKHMTVTDYNTEDSDIHARDKYKVHHTLQTPGGQKLCLSCLPYILLSTAIGQWWTLGKFQWLDKTHWHLLGSYHERSTQASLLRGTHYDSLQGMPCLRSHASKGHSWAPCSWEEGTCWLHHPGLHIRTPCLPQEEKASFPMAPL